MRLAVYTDYVYRRLDGTVYGERAFVTFVCELRASTSRLVIAGRLDPVPGRWNYALPDDVDFVGLPHYESLTRPGRAAVGMVRSLRHFWRALDDVDTVWLLGPHLHSLAFAAIATLRGRSVRLGVRQDLPRYVRSRHPDRRLLHWAAAALEASFRVLALVWPVIVVGPDLARRYRHARRLLATSVSLVRRADVVDAGEALRRPAPTTRRILSVGRLDTEKNPLLLADVLARLCAGGGSWRLLVAGDGPLAAALQERLAQLGVAEHAELLGYVPIDRGLGDLYREADAFLHVSWTEGLPQVLFEAFAAGTPVVATAVGGVAAAAEGAALLIEPGDADAAAAALRRVVGEPDVRERLVRAGVRRAADHTLEAEAARVAAFLQHR
jgi:glycosyltransferase involved in cell wall biosynthesis